MNRAEGKSDRLWGYVSVVRISDGNILYSGDSLVAAARALDPGTCFGTDAYENDAQAKAKTLAWVLSQLPPLPRAAAIGLARAQAIVVGAKPGGN